MKRNFNRDYYDYIRERRTKKQRPVYRFIKSLVLLSVVIICFFSGLVFFKIISVDQIYKYAPFVPHKLQSITLSVNGKATICSMSKICTVTPSDKIQIISVKTDGLTNFGLELYSGMFETEKLLQKPYTFLDLCPQLSFEEPQIVEISALWFGWNLGTIKIKIKWSARHWINQANSTKDLRKKEYFLLKALQEDPNHPIARLKLAEAYFKAGDFNNAAKEYERIIKNGPSKQVLKRLIECYKRQNKRKLAVDTYLRAIELFPEKDFVQSFISYLKKYFSPRDTKKILEKSLKKIPSELKPNFWLFLTDVCTQIKDWKCVTRYSEKASKDIAFEPVIKYNLAVAYFQNKNYTKALHYLSAYLKDRPNDLDALKLKAACYEKLKKWKEAEKIYHKLVQKNPSDELISSWIKSLQAMQDKKGLIDAYVYLTEIKPNDWTVWFNLGVLYFEGGNKEKAINALNKALNIKPSDIRTLSYLQKIYHDNNNKKKELEILDKLIKAQPANIKYYESYFDLTKSDKQLNRTESVMRECVKNLPQETKCYDMLLYVLLKQKKKREATKILEKLVKLQPRNYDLLFQMAKLNYDTGRLSEALKNLRDYLKMKPDDVEAKNLYLQTRLRLLKLRNSKTTNKR